MSKRVEIYALSDETGLRYIGKANNSAARLKRHIIDARRRRTPVYDWINSLTARGLRPTMAVIEVTDEIGWAEAECQHIATARATGARLLNLADGGNEPACSIETRRQNARDLNARLDADPNARRMWQYKRQVADGLRRGQIRNSTRAQLREAAALAPHLFGAWATIPDRAESSDGTPI